MITPNDFTRIKNDTNGNPRYVCHFLMCLDHNHDVGLGMSIDEKYKIAIKKMNRLGGRKFHNKQYGGGIVFQSYNLQDTCNKINELIKNL